MKKYTKRLMAVLLSFIMTFACVLQVGAEEGTAPATVKLTGEELTFTGKTGKELKSTDNQTLYEGIYGYKVTEQSAGTSITLEPKDGITTFSFGIMRENPAQEFNTTWNNLSTEVEGMEEFFLSVDDSNAEYVLYTIDLWDLIKVASGTELQLTFTKSALSYTVSLVKDGAGFTTTAKDGAKVEGGTYQFDVTVYDSYAEKGYVPFVLKDGKSQGVTSTHEGNTYHYTISDIGKNIEITIGLEKPSYKITISKTNADSYTTTALEQNNVEYGSDYSFVVTPVAGYDETLVGAKLSSETEENATLTHSGNNYTVANITGDVTVEIYGPSGKQNKTLTFVGSSDEVTFAEEGGGAISGTKQVNYGENFTFTVKLADNYKKSIGKMVVSANGVPLVAASDSTGSEDTRKYTVSSVTSDTVITVSGIEKNTYKVTLTDKAGYYTLSTSDSTTVTAGESFRFKVTVEPKYAATFNGSTYTKYLKVNGETCQDIVTFDLDTDTYTVKKVTADIVISIDTATEKWEVSKFDVTLVQGDHYDITKGGGIGEDNKADYGASISFTVTPKPGYRVSSVTYTMGGVTAAATLVGAGQYTVSDITAEVTVNVVTEAVKYKITFVDPTGYNTQYVGTYEATSGTDITVNADSGAITVIREANCPNNLYEFAGWIYNGKLLDDSENQLKFTNADQEAVLTASIVIDYDNLFELSLEHNWTGTGDSLRLWLIGMWQVPTSQLVLQGITPDFEIVEFGFLYSNQEITFNEENLKTLLGLDALKSDGLQTVKDGLYVMNYKIGTTPGVKNEAKTSYAMTFRCDYSGIKSDSSTRYVKAYLHFKADGNDYYVMTETGSEGITYSSP